MNNFLALRLSEAMRFYNTWPSRIDNRSETLRSQKLAKEANAVFPESCHTVFSGDVLSSFERFVHARSLLVTDTTITEEAVRAEIYRPKAILATDWNKSLFDGAVTPETKGFINEDCMPPWDCWLDVRPTTNSVTGACLLSWVPIEFADCVDFGIRVDAAECLAWAELAGSGQLVLRPWGASWNE